MYTHFIIKLLACLCKWVDICSQEHWVFMNNGWKVLNSTERKKVTNIRFYFANDRWGHQNKRHFESSMKNHSSLPALLNAPYKRFFFSPINIFHFIFTFPVFIHCIICNRKGLLDFRKDEAVLDPVILP